MNYYRTLNSEIHKKRLEAGYRWKHMTTKSWIPKPHKIGSSLKRITHLLEMRMMEMFQLIQSMINLNWSSELFKKLRFQLKAFGKTEMVSASGENSRFKDTCYSQRDMKVIGKILKRNADCTEYSFFLMMKIQENLQKGLKSRMKQELWQILSWNTISILKICPLTKFLKSIMKKSIEYWTWHKIPSSLEVKALQIPLLFWVKSILNLQKLWIKSYLISI